MALWRILLKAQTQTDASLTCDECLAILNYLADQAADNANLESLWPAVARHLARCPGCHERYLGWLRELETGKIQISKRKASPDLRSEH